MTVIDWCMVVLWVLGTSAFGFNFKKHIKTTRDYLMAGRKLKWWQIGIAQSADSIDATDFVAISGAGYRMGFTQLGFVWWGMGIGSVFLSRYIAPLLYRTGVVTNAEFLELRYTPGLRVVSAVIQILYRFIAMALVVYALAKVLSIVIGFDLWTGVWISMALTLLYVFASGQLGVVMAAIPQVALMQVVAAVIFISALSDIGGVAGFIGHSDDFGDLLHLAGQTKDGIPNGVYLWGLILVLFTYPIVNQTVAQRIVAAATEVDARKGSIAALLPWCFVTGLSVLVGIMGVVLMPELSTADPDDLFPLYMQKYLPAGMLGLGVATLMVASMSTGAGIGTAIAGLLTNDLFKFLSSGKYSDKFMLMWTRVFSAAAIICGTCFAMFIEKFGGMIPFYVAFTGTFVLPLTVPYIGAALFPKASRYSGVASLIGGIMVGAVLFTFDQLPVWMSQSECRPFWVLGTSVIVMIVWSLIENRIKGPIPEDELASILNACCFGRQMSSSQVEQMIEERQIKPWEGQKNVKYATVGWSKKLAWYSRPGTYEGLTVVLMVVLMIWWW